MGDQNRNLRDISYFVAFAAGGVALVGNAVVSAFTVGMVVDAVEAAIPSKASVTDWVTVATVFWASAPIVLAFLACVIIVSHYGWEGTGTIVKWGIPWVIAGLWSYAVLAPGQDAFAALANTPPVNAGPFTPLAKVVSWTLRPYSQVVCAQGLFLGFVASLAYLHFTNPERNQAS
ncbi:hypothetical protein ACFVT6_12885 [Streptomyces sp. NPDC058049]|uniref:hypothetical protein n=1 Tax=Streptomyces sp. NPDC058049 TaxID=3346314 RepID=UPI0036F0DF2C